MTDRNPENPPAFPVAWPTPNCPEPGMTLRDYFAAAALTGLLANQQIAKDAVKEGYGPDVTQTWHADTAYAFADAMLKKRSEA